MTPWILIASVALAAGLVASGALRWQLDLPAEDGQGVWSTTDGVVDVNDLVMVITHWS